MPQNLLGLLLRAFFKGDDSEYNGVTVRRSAAMSGGISLGKYIIVRNKAKDDTIRHEYGHCRQSQILGWFYLLVIGLPSLVWAMTYGTVISHKKHDYYDFYTEKWADKLGGVNKKK